MAQEKKNELEAIELDEATNALSVIDQAGIRGELQGTAQAFCSLPTETVQQKAVVYKAMSNPDRKIADLINSTIIVTDIYTEYVQVTNRETGVQSIVPRTVLIDAEGVSYSAVSVGIFNAVKKLIMVFGMPTWTPGIAVKVVQITRGAYKMLTLDAVIG